MKEKLTEFFKTLPSRVKNYLSTYFKSLNYFTYICAIVIAVSLFVIDYFTKHIAFNYLTDGNLDAPKIISSRQGTTIIPYILDLQFTANLGAAWGSFSGKMWALCIISFIASIFLTFNILFRFNKYNKIMMTGVVLMAPGAIGNLVDRMGCLLQKGIYKGGVIDFLHFTFWPSFPICNLADYYLTVGVVFLLIGFVIEFRKEYKIMKEEEEKEKETAVSSQDDVLKKLKDIENQDSEKEIKQEKSIHEDSTLDNSDSIKNE